MRFLIGLIMGFIVIGFLATRERKRLAQEIKNRIEALIKERKRPATGEMIEEEGINEELESLQEEIDKEIDNIV